MSNEPNQLHRFKKLRRDEDWPQCRICREDVPSGITIFDHDQNLLVVLTICDGCLGRAKSSPTGWVSEFERIYDAGSTPT
jgi:MinD superfamily P-loop ATPase